MSGPNGAGGRPGPDGGSEVTGYATKTPGRPAGRRRKRGGAETLMVPEADFRSYYGRQILKSPTWARLDIAGYLFGGGFAAAASSMAALADVSGHRSLVRIGRLTAAAGMGASLVGLVHDLGRPERFTNMLRVFKPTSPMSVGTYIISPFSGLAFAAAAGDVTGKLPTLTRIAGAGAAVIAPAVATYTAVLVADTAVPAWHETYRQLPFVFAGSAVLAGGSIGTLLGATEDSGPSRRMMVIGGAVELGAGEVMERSLGVVGENFHQGRAGALMKAAKASSAAAVVGAMLARRFPVLGRLAGVLGIAGSVLTRFGIFEAGIQSTEDPRYVVVPQRERLAREGRASADTR